MNISFDYYRIFYYVAKYQNVTQATRMLMCNQPNVTRVIQEVIPSRSVVLLKRDDGILSIAARMLEQLMMEFTNL